MHGTFKTGAESTYWKIKKILKAAFQILHDSPARHEDYKSITGCTTSVQLGKSMLMCM